MSSGYKSPAEVQAMFGRIAQRYDLMNRVMTMGRDLHWRRLMVRELGLPTGATVLDIASGTGDIAFEVRRQYSDATVIAGDFALPMMQVGQRRPAGKSVAWLGADALNLALPEAHFDAVVSGYLFRNVPDIERALAEQFRILKPGGRLATLDSTPPPPGPLRPFILVHLKFAIPLLGRIISPDPDAYAYLPASTLRFKTPEDLAQLMYGAGFVNVRYQRLMFGTMAVHWATRPKPNALLRPARLGFSGMPR
ncbi:MAG: ubiquinone/menaquinone biosynthesis methyltransferase [Anaerolineae bacterium]|nr:ubiquinone/menaquinone biosynthesis methyltransferase [Anaerolineae bacterium]